ncbi:hypothetical protein LEP1GSC125_3842 [Leptospira mayottensis 200901122]|uniref:Uncharacterized protein n=1 Tax=Leptospira mayottensis 200901122 TaxID=1193010 RepID=A0AA87MR28_9LEPT|nr:hypothetical protein LEP1GSC125_3842 [Leptospira mayottensis 200901122]
MNSKSTNSSRLTIGRTIHLEVPQDKNGSFKPREIPKGTDTFYGIR